MKKTKHAAKPAVTKTKLALRTEVIRELKPAELQQAVGGVWNIHSLHSSCC